MNAKLIMAAVVYKIIQKQLLIRIQQLR